MSYLVDSYSAYLWACAALGVLRFAEGFRSRASLGTCLNVVGMGVDGVWAVLSVLVVMIAPADSLRGVALWFALGTLGGWLLVRKGHLLKVDVSEGKQVPLPDWYKEYTVCFGAGLVLFSASAWFSYLPEAPKQVPNFLRSSVGTLWLCFMVFTSLRASTHVLGLYKQRTVDRGVLSGLRSHPECTELFGEVQRVVCKLEQSAHHNHDDVFVYRVFGEKTTGVVVAEFRKVNDSLSEVVQGLVYLDTGERSSLNACSDPKTKATFETLITTPLKQAS